VRELLGHRKLFWLVFVAAIVIALPTLDVGLVGDDLPQAEFLTAQREATSPARWWDMFVLVSGPRAHNEELRSLGQLPWWVDPDLRVAFFRPLSVATHQLDHRLWHDAVWAMHLHSILWYAVACVLVWVVARRLSSSAAAAGVASLVYVGAFGHLVPVGWLAHRNAVISAVFSLLAILAHDRWRRDQDKLAGLLAPIALLAALLAGEAGVVTLAFLLAHALILDRGTRAARAMSLAPGSIVVVLWRVLYDALGYGVTGSGAYLDPVADPGSFLRAVPERCFALLSFCVSPPFIPEFPAIAWWVLTLVLIAITAVFVVRVERPAARFGVLAAVLGCIPLAASVPFERLLVLTSVGMALCWGELLDAWLLSGPARLSARAAAGLVVVVHLVISPVAFVGRGLEVDEMRLNEATFTEAAWPGSPTMAGKTVVVVHTPNYLVFEYLLRTLAADGIDRLAMPERLWVLHAGDEPARIERLDAHTLELRAPLGWSADVVTSFWRSPTRAPFVVGDRVETRDFTAMIEEVERGKATRVVFRFETPLDDPTQVWVQWRDGKHRKVNPAAW
jgi:hypothetical protein